MLAIIIFLVLVFLISLAAKKLEGTIITGPIVFTLAGIGTYFLTPTLTILQSETGSVSASSAILLNVGEVTLAVILFGDAIRISLKQVIIDSDLPERLLFIGMPLTILAGALVGYWLFGEKVPFWEAAILATVLAPTDASLGAMVVNSKLVPERIREALSIESGLNDGLSMPFFVLFLALAGYELHEMSGSWVQHWVQYTVMQIGFGILIGFVIGWASGKLIGWSERKEWMEEGAYLIALLAVAIMAWGLAGAAGGNGFIAAFVAGFSLRWVNNKAVDYAKEFEESWGQLLTYFIFFLFGLMIAPQLQMLSPILWLYGIISLTLVRMVPVAISMIGTRLRPPSILFMGWFGPRGLASVVLGLIYLEELTVVKVNPTIIHAVITTVLLSVLAHGISAVPLSKVYARILSKLAPDAPEFS